MACFAPHGCRTGQRSRDSNWTTISGDARGPRLDVAARAVQRGEGRSGRADVGRPRCRRRGFRRREGGRGRRPRQRRREGRRRAGRGRRADREGEATPAGRVTRVRLLRLARPRRGADRDRPRRRGPPGGRHLRGQPLGAVRGQRPLPPPRLEAAGRPALDAPTGPHDDLLPHRRHGDALRPPRPRAAAVDHAPDRRLGRGAGGDHRRARLGRPPEVGGGDRLHRASG